MTRLLVILLYVIVIVARCVNEDAGEWSQVVHTHYYVPLATSHVEYL